MSLVWPVTSSLLLTLLMMLSASCAACAPVITGAHTVNLLDSKYSATLPAVTTMHQALVNSTLPARQLLVICMLPADEYCLKD